MSWRTYWQKRKDAMASSEMPALDPRILANRSVVADTIIGGGISVADILHGKIAEHQLPADVRAAFHAQYPNLHGGLVAEVQRLHGHPAAIQGLVNGIKGKLFEQQYVDYLNAGQHLPHGFHAVLAHAANQPGWDIKIVGPHGHVHDLLQAKATSSTGVIRHAVHLHPDIGVVSTHGVAAHLHAAHAGLHVTDSGISNTVLTHHVSHAVGQAVHASAFHLPVLGFLAVVGFEGTAFLRGRQSGTTTLANISVGAASTTAAAGAAHFLPLILPHMTHPLGWAVGFGVGAAWLVSKFGQALIKEPLQFRDAAREAVNKTRATVSALRAFQPGQGPGFNALSAAAF